MSRVAADAKRDRPGPGGNGDLCRERAASVAIAGHLLNSGRVRSSHPLRPRSRLRARDRLARLGVWWGVGWRQRIRRGGRDIDLGTATATTMTASGIDPLEGAATTPVQASATVVASRCSSAWRSARHEGYDRVVFPVPGSAAGYRIAYVEPPLKEDGSGTS